MAGRKGEPPKKRLHGRKRETETETEVETRMAWTDTERHKILMNVKE